MTYCEELHLGQWRPVVYAGTLSKPSHGNSAPQRRGIKQVAKEDQGKSLDELREIYGE